MSKQDEQQAIHEISAMIAQWWQKHGETMMHQRSPRQMITAATVGYGRDWHI